MGALRMSTRADAATTQLDMLGLQLSGIEPPTGWSLLDERGRGTRFLSLPVRSALNSPASTHMDFWSINPYVGCEFGCTYCYARDTHRYTMERHGPDDTEAMPAWQAFEKRILVKTDIVEVLARTLDPARLAGHSLVIGTATDCYQPAERKFRLTRGILELLLHYRGLSIGIITKSPLVTRDLDAAPAARRAARGHRQHLTRHRRRPARAAARAALAGAGGATPGACVASPTAACAPDCWWRRFSPASPTTGQASRAHGKAKEAGARYVVGSALRLGPAARHRFLPVLAREFPAARRAIRAALRAARRREPRLSARR